MYRCINMDVQFNDERDSESERERENENENALFINIYQLKM